MLSLPTKTFLVLLALTTAHAQRDHLAYGKPLTASAPDPQIAAALKQVSPEKIRATITALVAFNNRSTISSNTTDLPQNTGVLAASTFIEQQFHLIDDACNHCLEIHVDDFIEPASTTPNSRITQPTRIRNVYAILRGSDPIAAPRRYLVTGHYDTRGTDVMNTRDPAPGANDDSSGTAVSLEAARVLSHTHFPATLVFVCVAGEEQGLNGSKHLAELARKEGWQLEGVLNNDIVGGDTTPGETLQNKSLVRVFSQGIYPKAPADDIARQLTLGLENDGPSRQLARTVLAVDRTYFPRAPHPFEAVMELRLDRFLRGGDHSSFSAAGFPAIRFTEWRENFDHQHQLPRIENGKQYGDLLQYDDFSYIAQVARLNIATLATLAASPGTPRNVHIVTSNLDNNTTLRWDAPLQTSATVQYRIVWRETATTDWQRYTLTNATTTTLPISKDNVFFGIQSCDQTATHCTAAVAPTPEPR